MKVRSFLFHQQTTTFFYYSFLNSMFPKIVEWKIDIFTLSAYIPLKRTDYKHIKYGSLFVQYIVKAIFSTIASKKENQCRVLVIYRWIRFSIFCQYSSNLRENSTLPKRIVYCAWNFICAYFTQKMSKSLFAKILFPILRKLRTPRKWMLAFFDVICVCVYIFDWLNAK